MYLEKKVDGLSLISDDVFWLGCHLAVGDRDDPVTGHQPVKRKSQLSVVSVKMLFEQVMTFHPNGVNHIDC